MICNMNTIFPLLSKLKNDFGLEKQSVYDHMSNGKQTEKKRKEKCNFKQKLLNLSRTVSARVQTKKNLLWSNSDVTNL